MNRTNCNTNRKGWILQDLFSIKYLWEFREGRTESLLLRNQGENIVQGGAIRRMSSTWFSYGSKCQIEGTMLITLAELAAFIVHREFVVAVREK